MNSFYIKPFILRHFEISLYLERPTFRLSGDNNLPAITDGPVLSSSYLRKSHLNSAIIWLGVFQMAEAPLIKTFRSGATGLILSLCNEIKLVEYINHAVTWDPKQWKVSPGQHILALVINTLCGRVPLYRVEKFYEDQDVEGLFGVGRTAKDFNHFALGRALDKVNEAGSSSIFTGLTLRNLITSGAPLQFAHGDTTSKVMYGAYEREDNGDPDKLKINLGYSKDKRFDLKQIVMGLVTIGRGMPLLGNVIPRPIVTSPMTICFKSKRLSLLYPRFIFNLSGSPLSSRSYAPYITLLVVSP